MKINYLQQLILLAVLVVVFLTIYAVSQQVLRQSANDPQIQLAQDAAAALASGQGASSVVPNMTVDISKSLATFYIIYDKSGNVLDSSASLNGKTPALPSGVLDSAKKSGQDAFTWQPDSNARSAVVVESVNGGKDGYVLVGRSIKEVEKREGNVEAISFLGLLFSVLLLLAASFSRRFGDA